MADSYSRFENIIVNHRDSDDSNAAGIGYAPKLDYVLLEKLLSRSVADGDSPQSGGMAKALDMWIAEQLRNAGFKEDTVWPRLHAPRVLDPSVLDFVGSLNAQVAEQCCKKLQSYAGNAAYVMGSAYKKQVDVGISSWMTGPELLVSTKTMMASFGKNLANRFEEAYGDVKNLKGRHPLAAIGFYFIVDSKIIDEPGMLSKAVAMLEKLQLEQDAYDVTCLQLIDVDPGKHASVSGRVKTIPASLSPEHFFETLIGSALRVASPECHAAVRQRYSCWK